MANKADMMTDLQDWLRQFRGAILVNNGKAMCEASRMVISILSILRAYHPGSCSAGIEREVVMTFKESLIVLSRHLKPDEDPDGYNKLYHKNIGWRLATLEKMLQTPEPTPVLYTSSSKSAVGVHKSDRTETVSH